jgi:hypothetical protein
MLGQTHSAEARENMRKAHLRPEVHALHVAAGRAQAARPQPRHTQDELDRMKSAWAARPIRACVHCDYATQAYHLLVPVEMTNGDFGFECRFETACNRRIRALMARSA